MTTTVAEHRASTSALLVSISNPVRGLTMTGQLGERLLRFLRACARSAGWKGVPIVRQHPPGDPRASPRIPVTARRLVPDEWGREDRLPLYVTLRDLDSDELQMALDELSQVPLDLEDREDFHRALNGDDWREILVSAVRLVLDHAATSEVDSREGQEIRSAVLAGDLAVLWRSIEKGSWALPQLVVVALVLDRDFIAHAQRLIASRVAAHSLPSTVIATKETEGLHAEIAHAGRDGQLLVTLAEALRIAGAPSVADGTSVDPEVVHGLRATDRIDSELIVRYWHENLVAAFNARGIALPVPSA